MKIKILGSRGEISADKPHYHRHSGLLIDDKILCDLGEKEFLNYDPSCILITHLHPDHAFFIREKCSLHTKCLVIAPENTGHLDFLEIVSTSFTFGEYGIIPIPTIHSLKVRSQGYLIIKGDKKIFYTGDLVSIGKKYYPLLANLNAVITEASFMRRGGIVRTNTRGDRYGHAGVPDLVQLFKHFTNCIIFTHFGTWFLKDPQAGIKKIKNIATGTLIVETGYDGKEFEI